MRILGIETSCDETGLAIYDFESSGSKVDMQKVYEALYSSVDFHQKTGGVVPEIAARKQVEALPGILKDIKNSTLLQTIDRVAVVTHPGLSVSLTPGINFAFGIKKALGVDLVEVNHLYAHFFAVFLSHNSINVKEVFPSIFVLASGGHTAVYYVKNPQNFILVAHTIDDAIGEAFDKSARILGLGYPGGPQISHLASEKNSCVSIDFGISMKDSLDFSFSGLKTAFLYYFNKNKNAQDFSKNSLAKSFEYAASANLENKVSKILDANIKKKSRIFSANSVMDKDIERVQLLNEYPKAKTLTFGGGVAANDFIRKNLQEIADKYGINYLLPEKKYCGDNGSQVCIAGYFTNP